jgi:hypothetical protein
MGVSDEAKNVIPLKFLRKIKNFFFPLVNSIRGHTLYVININLLFLQCPRIGETTLVKDKKFSI